MGVDGKKGEKGERERIEGIGEPGVDQSPNFIKLSSANSVAERNSPWCVQLLSDGSNVDVQFRVKEGSVASAPHLLPPPHRGMNNLDKNHPRVSCVPLDGLKK